MRFFPILVLLLCGTTFAADPKAEGKPNRLADEVSPYLLQHSRNPVDWYPWGPEAFAKAKKENKLVFLSIGYSSCHWCHVMEKESFSNPEIAKQMNANFVCIKVDREERPDIDEVYMTSLQVLRTSGGWPLSMFLTADAKPIFGGTYWPPEDRKTMAGETIPGFKSVLAKVLELDKDDHKGLLAQADQVADLVTEQMQRNTRDVPLLKLDRELVTDAADAFEFDPLHGGFGMKANMYRGTKFPRASALAVVLKRGPDKKPVFHTLEKMAAGGIYDHLGGGFHRYSTERTWTVPHFEKMLYDNAQLMELYADAYKQDPKPEFKRVIAETLGFVAREMTSPEGGFYSALDADSNGKEGEFYVWTTKELDDILGADAAAFKALYGEKPNFEEKYYILRTAKPATDEEIAKFATAKAKLFAVRAKRERPFLDTKVLAGWNGQMVAAYARAGQVLMEPKYTASAEKAAAFLLEKMRNKDGRLFRMFAGKPGEKPAARGTGFLEDYAYVVRGLLVLHETTGNAQYLTAARELADLQLKFFTDSERGGFFMTPDDGEKLFARGKDYYDGAQPSGNGMSARNFAQLWTITKDEKYKFAAEKTIKLYGSLLRSSPTTAPQMAEALGILLDSAK